MNTSKSILTALLLAIVAHIDLAEASFISNLVTKLPTPPAPPAPPAISVVAIPGLYNTGVASAGAVDPHYALTVSADPSSTAYVASSFPSSWLPNAPPAGSSFNSSLVAQIPVSQWIAPAANQNSAVAGNYVYQTTFNLTGFNLGTVSITGRWAANDMGLDILINGLSTGQTTGSIFNPFAINTGFVSGINTLDFLVLNDPSIQGLNPTGLRVEFLTATALSASGAPTSVVPLPAAVWLLGSGLVGLLGFARRRHGIKQA